MDCPKCKSSDTKKNGVRQLKNGGNQQWVCKSCNYAWIFRIEETEEPETKIEEPVDHVRDSVNKKDTAYWRKRAQDSETEKAFQQLLLVAIEGAAPAFASPPPMPEAVVSKHKTPTRLILGLSDHHANRVIDPQSIEGFNEYNFDIYANRLWSIVRGTISLAQSQYTMKNQIDQLSVNYLGDIGNDSQRPENMRTNQMAENVASLVTAHINAQAIDSLLRAKTPDGSHYLFPKIQVRGMVGNEPRFDKKINHAEPFRNWDWVIYQWMAMSLRDAGGRVEWTIPWSPKIVVDELGHRFLLDHGYDIRGWAGIPYYGMKRSNSQEQYLRTNRGGFHYRMTGHIHTQATLPEMCRSHFVVPSLCGVDGYAHNSLGVSGEVGQTLLAVTGRGVISNHLVYASDNITSPFEYDKDMAIDGAHIAMDAWLNKKVTI